MMNTLMRGSIRYVRVEEYSEAYDLSALDVLRVAVEHNLKLDQVIVASDTRPEDQNTEAGNVDWVPCVSLYIPETGQ